MKSSTMFRTTVSAALCLTLTSGAVMPKQALAWDWLSAGLALFQVGAEYAYLNKQVSYLDNKGRDKYMGQIKDGCLTRWHLPMIRLSKNRTIILSIMINPSMRSAPWAII